MKLSSDSIVRKFLKLASDFPYEELEDRLDDNGLRSSGRENQKMTNRISDG